MYAVQEMHQYWSKSTTHKPPTTNDCNNTDVEFIHINLSNGHIIHQKQHNLIVSIYM